MPTLPTRPTTPIGISSAISLFCQSINGSSNPLYVPVRSQWKYKQGNCWENVERHIETNGGEIQHGWMIWQMTDMWIEAEFHSVWKSPDGEIVDITTKEDGERTILFLPDPSKSPDQGYQKTQYKALRSGKRWQEWLERMQAEQDLRAKHYNPVSRSWNVPPEELKALHLQIWLVE